MTFYVELLDKDDCEAPAPEQPQPVQGPGYVPTFELVPNNFDAGRELNDYVDAGLLSLLNDATISNYYAQGSARPITLETLRQGFIESQREQLSPHPTYIPLRLAEHVPSLASLCNLPFSEIKPLRDGEPCAHTGCLRHISHPCEGCGRIGGHQLASKNGTNQSAVISKDGLHRYRLSRWWGPGLRVAFLMMNPSTADAYEDDATIRKCIGFAKKWGYDGIEVINLFSLRSRDPKELLKDEAHIRGLEYEQHLHVVLRECGYVVVAWGCESTLSKNHGRLGSYIKPTMDWIRREFPHLTMKTLGYTKGGTPRHPLMLAYSTELEDYR